MKYDISKTIVPMLLPVLGAHVMRILYIYIAKSWLFRNKWCIFAQKTQAKHEGFEYAPLLGDSNNPHFVREFIK